MACRRRDAAGRPHQQAMSSRHDQFFSGASDLIAEYLGGTVTRRPNGNAQQAESVAGCLWAEGEPRLDTTHGRDNVRRGNLWIPATQTVGLRDTWVIAGEVWQVEAIGELDGRWRRVKLIMRGEIMRRPRRP